MTYTRNSETVERTELPNGQYRYVSNVRGEVIKSSRVLYTHCSIFAVTDIVDGEVHPLLFHKTEGAALRAKGYPQYGWRKVAVIEITTS